MLVFTFSFTYVLAQEDISNASEEFMQLDFSISNEEIFFSINSDKFLPGDSLTLRGYVEEYQNGIPILISVSHPENQYYFSIFPTNKGIFSLDITIPEETTQGDYIFQVQYGESGMPVILPIQIITDENTGSIIIPNKSSIEYAQKSFQPNLFSIDESSKITWINKDSTVHTVNSAIRSEQQLVPDGVFSGYIGPGETFEIFLDAGNYEYFCILHPWLTGSIDILPSDKPREIVTQQDYVPIEVLHTADNLSDLNITSCDGCEITAEISEDRMVGPGSVHITYTSDGTSNNSPSINTNFDPPLNLNNFSETSFWIKTAGKAVHGSNIAFIDSNNKTRIMNLINSGSYPDWTNFKTKLTDYIYQDNNFDSSSVSEFAITLPNAKLMEFSQFEMFIDSLELTLPYGKSEEPKVIFDTQNLEWEIGENIEFSGTIRKSESSSDLSIQVFDTRGNLIDIRQIDMNDNSIFNYTLNTQGSGYKEPGWYKTIAKYGDGGTPTEFYFKLVPTLINKHFYKNFTVAQFDELFYAYPTEFSSGQMHFDGSKNFLMIPNMMGHVDELSVELWFKPTGNKALPILESDEDNGLGSIFRQHETFDKILLDFDNSQYVESNIFSSDIWHHLFITYDGDNTTLFVNGKEIVNSTVSITQPNDFLYLGHRSPTEFFEGDMSYLRIYSKAMDTTFIQKSFLSNKPISENSSMFILTFDNIESYFYKYNQPGTYGDLLIGNSEGELYSLIDAYVNKIDESILENNHINEEKSDDVTEEIEPFPISEDILSDIWKRRSDLQTLFPEVSSDDFIEMKNWAKNSGWNEERSLHVLIPQGKTPEYYHLTVNSNPITIGSDSSGGRLLKQLTLLDDFRLFDTALQDNEINLLYNDKLDLNPLARWTFDNSFEDSINGHHGHIPYHNFVMGKQNEAFIFNQDGVIINHDDSFNIYDQLTISGWIKPLSTEIDDDTSFIISKDDSWTIGISPHSEEPNTIFVTVRVDGLDVTKKYSFEPDKWMHFVAMFDGTEIKFYKNGKFVDYSPLPAINEDYNYLIIIVLMMTIASAIAVKFIISRKKLIK